MDKSKLNFPKGLMLLAFLAASLLVKGQTPLNYIPSTADVVITFNMHSLGKKVNLAQLQQYDFFQASLKEMYQTPGADSSQWLFMERLMADPASLGFATGEPFYVFIEKNGYDTYATFVQRLANRAVYESAVLKFKGEQYLPNLTELQGQKIWQKGSETFAWNDEVVLNIIRIPGAVPFNYEQELGYEYDYSDSTVYVDEEIIGDTFFEESIVYEEEPAIEEDIEILPSMEDVQGETMGNEPDTAAYKWALKVLNKEYLQPITRHERFAIAKGRNNDVHFWMDYAFFMDNMASMQQLGMAATNTYAQAMSAMSGFMDVFYGDTYMSVGLNFENGRLAMRSQLFFNEDMKRFYQRALDVKFNKKMLRYVKGGEEMFGYFYLNYNIKNTIEETKSLLYKIFDATPQYGQAAADAMKILGIFIDEEAVGNLLKGDLMVAVSGMQSVEVQTKTYEYDADFNYIEKDTTLTKTFPIFTVLASYGNGKDIQKFIDLGLHTEVLKQNGKFYTMTFPDLGGQQFYLAKHDGLLIFTNNQYLVQQNLDKGFDKKRRLDKSHRKRLCEMSSVVYWDIPNTIKSAIGSETDSNIGMMGFLNNMGKEVKSMEMTSLKKVDQAVESETYLNMTNGDLNALVHFFNLLNDIYLESIGGAKI